MVKWTDAQKKRVKGAISRFTENDPMIVSEQMWYDLKENGLLDRERTLVKTKDGLIVKIPWSEGILLDGKPTTIVDSKGKPTIRGIDS